MGKHRRKKKKQTGWAMLAQFTYQGNPEDGKLHRLTQKEVAQQNAAGMASTTKGRGGTHKDKKKEESKKKARKPIDEND